MTCASRSWRRARWRSRCGRAALRCHVAVQVLQQKRRAPPSVVQEAKLKVREVAKNPAAYKKLVQDLLVQALRKLGEPTAVVRVRQVDLALVKELVEPARKAYAAAFGEEAPTITIDSRDFLPPPPKAGDADAAGCSGGVVVTSADGRIVCSNTLDDRIAITYQANLPTIRAQLFGATAAVH
ncbi:V-type H+-transporting ATPase subunit E [Monoraphidium neglectum]|uniref:V-type H+-transporting ATPase subunit E n=1 Tax=Monoraphidium neglectum TaxID=145388 RepID=A0A0D2IZG8_9CHLO|nr:V-type H+-transporting ATPase subunit E [Monoraphidium neglectum]KIY93242.1 V-type H+-transporting ATPase subunit E [Monoraphidium neglectum]|eukprot:XP_013892262.1 V-type H+-transporting ATPase subunit E [Monoraphidium neglectum]